MSLSSSVKSYKDTGDAVKKESQHDERSNRYKTTKRRIDTLAHTETLNRPVGYTYRLPVDDDHCVAHRRSGYL